MDDWILLGLLGLLEHLQCFSQISEKGTSVSLLTSSALPSLQLSNKLIFCASTRAPSAVIANLFKLKSFRPITPDTVGP